MPEDENVEPDITYSPPMGTVEISLALAKIRADLISIDSGFAEILRRIEAKLDRLTPLADMIEAAKDNPMLAGMLGFPTDDGN